MMLIEQEQQQEQTNVSSRISSFLAGKYPLVTVHFSGKDKKISALLILLEIIKCLINHQAYDAYPEKGWTGPFQKTMYTLYSKKEKIKLPIFTKKWLPSLGFSSHTHQIFHQVHRSCKTS